MKPHSPADLMRSRRFLPFFITQALGAFNDNVYKNALLLIITFSAGSAMGVNEHIVVNLAAGLFILPFFILSPTAGQIADKYEKSSIIRKVKFAEIIIMGLAAVAFVYDAYWTLMFLLFAMGTQSAFFGPVKYAILPQHLKDSELVGGNALVEMGTFLAILAGTILAGILATLPDAKVWVALSVVIFAILGYISSRSVPEAPAADPSIQVNWNPATELVSIWRDTRQNRAVYLSIMAISWFWFLGASYLTQFPNFAKEVLHGDATVVTLLLTVFSVGIAIGSMLCERLSEGKVELGIVPMGAIGLTVFGADLTFAAEALRIDLTTPALGALGFWGLEHSGRVLTDLALIGIFGGLFIVPLYALIQQRSDPKRRAQVIAANNVLNAAFMVGSAIFAVIFLSLLGLSIPEYFLVLAIMNLVVSIYVFQQVPEFALRFVVWILSHTIYRVRKTGLEHIPEEGPVVLVCNHVSYMDALILGGAIRRPVRFVMDKQIAEMFGMRTFFRLAKTIPICSEKKDPETYQRAFERVREDLQEGNAVCIFPEGRLTTSGEVETFRKGIERIIAETPVPVVPMALQGLWGSFFSHKGRPALTKLPQRFWSRIQLVVAPAVAPQDVSAERLERTVRELRGPLA
ncbi:MAG: MFS transporter [Hahellaceae bacterium]|nr:MFS transporter [Hahellaceae bacterium]